MEAVKSSLNGSTYNVIDCTKVSHTDSTFDSFRVKLLDSYCKYLISDEAAEKFWGEKIICRRFYRPRNAKVGSLLQEND